MLKKLPCTYKLKDTNIHYIYLKNIMSVIEKDRKNRNYM